MTYVGAAIVLVVLAFLVGLLLTTAFRLVVWIVNVLSATARFVCRFRRPPTRWMLESRRNGQLARVAKAEARGDLVAADRAAKEAWWLKERIDRGQ